MTGNPRLDLLRAELQPYFANEVARLKLAYGEVILVNSSFASVNHFTSDGADVIRSRISCSQARDFHDRAFAYRSGLLQRFLETVPQLARAFPRAMIVVRPHPSEDQETWRRCAEGLGNVLVCHEGNVVPWLMAAQAVAHNGCTTAIEASILGKSPIANQPMISADFDIHRPNEISVRTGTFEQLCAAIAANWGRLGEPHPDLADYVAPRGNNLYSERVVDAVLEMTRLGLLEPGAGPCRRLLGRIKARARRHDKARQWEGNEGSVRYEAHRFQPMLAAETEGLVQRLSRTLRRFETVKVAQIKPDVFCLSA